MACRWHRWHADGMQIAMKSPVLTCFDMVWLLDRLAGCKTLPFCALTCTSYLIAPHDGASEHLLVTLHCWLHHLNHPCPFSQGSLLSIVEQWKTNSLMVSNVLLPFFYHRHLISRFITFSHTPNLLTNKFHDSFAKPICFMGFILFLAC